MWKKPSIAFIDDFMTQLMRGFCMAVIISWMAFMWKKVGFLASGIVAGPVVCAWMLGDYHAKNRWKNIYRDMYRERTNMLHRALGLPPVDWPKDE